MNKAFDRQHGPADYSWSKKQIVTIGIIVLTIFMYLAFRSMGIPPVVMSDEQRFNTYSRILDPAHAAVPSYLFYFIYRLTNQCGNGFLDCGRLMNLLELGLGSILLYSIGRKYLSKKTSAFIAIATLLAPWTSYVTYYMPEILYYLVFMALTWVTLNEESYRSTLLFDCVSGIALGALALVKPHAFFLIPAYAAYRIYSHALDGHSRDWMRLIGSLLLTIGVMFLIRQGIGFLIAGHAALDLFGTMYGSVAEKKSTFFYFQTLIHFYDVTKGHVYGLLVLFGFPLTAAFVTITSKTDGNNHSLKKISVWATTSLICMLGVTVAYTVQVNGMTNYESLERLHMRYYFFLFPLFTILGAIFCSGPQIQLKNWQKAAVVVVLIATLHAGFAGLKHYTPYAVDAPDLWSIIYPPKVLHTFALLQALALLVFIIRPSLASTFFTYLFLPLLVMHATQAVSHLVSIYRAPNVADRAGIFFAMTIRDQEPTAIVSDDGSEATRVAFHLDTKDIRIVEVPANRDLDSQLIAPDVRWIITLKDNPLDPSLHSELAYDMPGYRIWHRGSHSYDIDFTKADWPPGLHSVEGVYDPESLGRWSKDKTVTILFRNDIPANISLTIDASAFGPNIGEPFDIRIGNQIEQLKLGAGLTSTTLSYQNIAEHTRSVVVTVPHPISPREAGVAPDSRKIGIALRRLTIEPAPR